MCGGPNSPAWAATEFEAAEISNGSNAIQHGHAAEVKPFEVRTVATTHDRGNVFANKATRLGCWACHPGQWVARGGVFVTAEIANDSYLWMVFHAEVGFNNHSSAAIQFAID